MRENRPQKSTLNEDLMVYQNTPSKKVTRANFHILNEDDCHVYIIKRDPISGTNSNMLISQANGLV